MERDTYNTSLRDELASQQQRADDVAAAAQQVYELNTWTKERRQRIRFSAILLSLFVVLFIMRLLTPDFTGWSMQRVAGITVIEMFLATLALLSSYKLGFERRAWMKGIVGIVYTGVVVVHLLSIAISADFVIGQLTLLLFMEILYVFPGAFSIPFGLYKWTTSSIVFLTSLMLIVPRWTHQVDFEGFANSVFFLVFVVVTAYPWYVINDTGGKQIKLFGAMEKESFTQLSLLERVIPKVFLQQLLSNERIVSTCSGVTVMFVEVMKGRLQANGEVKWKKLGSDIDPSTLKTLSKVFRVLDLVVERNAVFKVETVGSEYMAVSGLPASCSHPNNTAYAIIETAIDMLETVHEHENLPDLSLQIGINAGTVVESILGRKLLPRWKLFGDTVNTASRMKSTGMAGQVHVSKAVRSLMMTDAIKYIATFDPEAALDWCDTNHYPKDKLNIESEIVEEYESFRVKHPSGNHILETLTTSNESVSDMSSHSETPLCLGDLCLGELVGFYFEPRGKVMVKGKGYMQTFWIKVFDEIPESEAGPSTPQPEIDEAPTSVGGSMRNLAPELSDVSTDEIPSFQQYCWNRSTKSLRINAFEDIQGVSSNHQYTGRSRNSRNTGITNSSYSSHVPASLRISISPAQLEAQRLKLFPTLAARSNAGKAKAVGKEMQEKFVAPRKNAGRFRSVVFGVIAAGRLGMHNAPKASSNLANTGTIAEHDENGEDRSLFGEKHTKVPDTHVQRESDNPRALPESSKLKKRQVVPFLAISQTNASYRIKKEKSARTKVGKDWDNYASRSRRRLLDATFPSNESINSDEETTTRQLDSVSSLDAEGSGHHKKTGSNKLLQHNKIFGSVYSFFQPLETSPTESSAKSSMLDHHYETPREEQQLDLLSNKPSHRIKQQRMKSKDNINGETRKRKHLLSQNTMIHSKSMGRINVKKPAPLHEERPMGESRWLPSLPGSSSQIDEQSKPDKPPRDSEPLRKVYGLKTQRYYKQEGDSMRELRMKNERRRRLSDLSLADASSNLMEDMLSSKRRLIKKGESDKILLSESNKNTRTKEVVSINNSEEVEPPPVEQLIAGGNAYQASSTTDEDVHQKWQVEQSAVGKQDYDDSSEGSDGHVNLAGEAIKLTQSIRQHSTKMTSPQNSSPKRRRNTSVESRSQSGNSASAKDLQSKTKLRKHFPPSGSSANKSSRRYSAPDNNSTIYEIRKKLSEDPDGIGKLLRLAPPEKISDTNGDTTHEDSDETDTASTASNSLVFDHNQKDNAVQAQTDDIPAKSTIVPKTSQHDIKIKQLIKEKQNSNTLSDQVKWTEAGEDFAHGALAFRKMEATTTPLNTSAPVDSLFADSEDGIKFNPVDRIVRYQSSTDFSLRRQGAVTPGKRRSSSIVLSQDTQSVVSVSSNQQVEEDSPRAVGGNASTYRPKQQNAPRAAAAIKAGTTSRSTAPLDVPQYSSEAAEDTYPGKSPMTSRPAGGNSTDLPRPKLRNVSLRFLEDTGNLENRFKASMLKNSNNLIFAGLGIFTLSSLFILFASVNDIAVFTVLRSLAIVACVAVGFITKTGKVPTIASDQSRCALAAWTMGEAHQTSIQNLATIVVTLGIVLHHLHIFASGVAGTSLDQGGVDAHLSQASPTQQQEEESGDEFDAYHHIVFHFSESVAQPDLWIWAIGWIVLNTILAFALVRMQELQQRYDFYLHYVSEEGRKVTTKMLHAMLPPTIADHMLLKEDRTQRTFSRQEEDSDDDERSSTHQTTRSEGEDSLLYHYGLQSEPVSLLMFDLVGFTKMSASIGPHALVSMLDRLYSAFDKTVERRSAHKIETIGDAFLVCCGAPDSKPPRESATTIAKCALDMMQTVETFPAPKGHRLEARIGIHIGHVLGGVIGSKMPRYQLFGEAVDKVMQLEASSVAGFVHASKELLQYIEDQPDLRILERREDGSGYIDRDKKGVLYRPW